MMWIFLLSGFIIESVNVIPSGEGSKIISPEDYAYFVITGDFNDTLFYHINSPYIQFENDSIMPTSDTLKFYGKIEENAPNLIHFSISDKITSIQDSLYLVPDIIMSASINKHIFNPLDTLSLRLSLGWNDKLVNYGITSAYIIIRDTNNLIIDSIMMERGDSTLFVDWQVPMIKGDFDIDLRVNTPNASGIFKNIQGFTTIPNRNTAMLFVWDAPNTPNFTARLDWYRDVMDNEFNDYFLWNVWYRGLPDSSMFLSNFIVWYESPQGEFVLSRKEQNLFAKYITSGEKCILIAPYMGRCALDSTFLINTLHTRFLRGFNGKGYLSRIEFLPENVEISHLMFTLYTGIKFPPLYGEEVDTVFPAKPLFSYKGGKFAGIYIPYSFALLDFYPEEISNDRGKMIFSVIKELFNTTREKKEISILSQNYPNPFTNYTIIPYTIIEDGFIELEICDITGRVVKKIDEGFRSKGEYTTAWDGKWENGKEAKAGLYFYHLILHSGKKTFSQTKKMLKLK